MPMTSGAVIYLTPPIGKESHPMAWDMIGTALSSINAAIDLARSISSAPNALERAELQHRLSEMMLALADAKVALAEAKIGGVNLESKIAELEEALRNKSNIV